jgi:Flp pilus assembly protein TadD
MPENQPPRSLLEKRWAAPAIVVAALAVVYAGTLVFSFVYDDNFQIVDNTWLTSARYIPRFFTSHVWAFAGISGVYWRPLFLLWFFVQRSIFGVAPAGWHAATVLMHAGATLLVYALARRLMNHRGAALMAALIFGLHPALLESVAWVSGVSDPLLAVVLIPAFLFFVDWREHGSGRALWLSLGFFVLALMAKEPAIMLLPILAAYAWIYHKEEGAGLADRARDAFSAVLPYLPVAAGYLVFHAALLGRVTYPDGPATFSNNVLTIPSLLAFYLKLLVWPAPISPEYGQRIVESFSAAQVLLPAVIIAGVIAVLWQWARHLEHANPAPARVVRFAAVWMFLPLLPVLYIKPLDPFDFAHARYLYLPCAGFAILVVTAIRTIPADDRRIAGLPTRQFGAALIVVIALAAANLVQQVYWASNIVLFTRGVMVAPRNTTGLTNLGIEFGKRQQYPKAIELLQRALRENPVDWHANFSLGYTYFVMGRTAEAEPLIEKAVRLHPDDADPDQWAYLGMTAMRLGDLTKAEWAVRGALKRRPDVPRYHHALALILEQQNRNSEAAQEFRETLKYDPSNADARSRLASLQAHP